MSSTTPKTTYSLCRNGFADLDVLLDTIKVMFVDHADDTPLAADGDIAYILAAAWVPAIASCPALPSKTVGSVGVGGFDSADLVFSNLSGDQSQSLIQFEDTGTEAASS